MRYEEQQKLIFENDPRSSTYKFVFHSYKIELKIRYTDLLNYIVYWEKVNRKISGQGIN